MNIVTLIKFALNYNSIMFINRNKYIYLTDI